MKRSEEPSPRILAAKCVFTRALRSRNFFQISCVWTPSTGVWLSRTWMRWTLWTRLWTGLVTVKDSCACQKHLVVCALLCLSVWKPSFRISYSYREHKFHLRRNSRETSCRFGKLWNLSAGLFCKSRRTHFGYSLSPDGLFIRLFICLSIHFAI